MSIDEAALARTIEALAREPWLARQRGHLARFLPAEVLRGLELYDWSVPRLLRLWWARKPWQRANNRLRRQADALRQAERHEEAVAVYQRYLAARPDHALGWCLYAHALRATRQAEAATAAYGRAVRLAPRDPFILSTVARYEHDMGEEARGAELLAQAVTVGRGHRTLNALSLMRIPGAAPADDCGDGAEPLWIDVTDALLYLMHSRAVSGIQRVIAELMRHALAHPQAARCVITRPWDGRVWSLSRGAQAEFLTLAAAGEGGGGRAASVIGRLFHTARAMEPRAGARLFRPGGFWTNGGNPPLHAALREAGMVNIGLIYDLIPLEHPQFCVSALVRDMAVTAAEEIASTDLLLAISEFSAASLRRHARALGIPAPPVLAVPLARERIAADPRASRVPGELRGRPFVLCPGTLESRKNQALLVRVWQALLDEGLAVPMLVIAGKQGWRTQEYDQAMAECAGARALVLRLDSPSDADMAALYDACLFTAFPSFAEGWGLPVGESLAHGKPCIASGRCSIPEAGGGLAEYIDPDDLPGATAAFRRMLADDALRAMLAARIAAEFRPRSWADAAGEMTAHAAAAQPRAPRGFEGPLLAPGTDWRPLPTTADGGSGEAALRLMLGLGWARPTRNGARPAGAEAPLCLRTAVPGELSLWLGDADAPVRQALPAGTHRIMVTQALTRLRFEAAP